MSEDLTKKVPDVEGDKLTLILTIVRKVEAHGAIFAQIFDRLDALIAQVDAIESRLSVIGTRLDAVENRLDALDTRFSAVETRLDAIETRLQSFEQTVKRSEHYLGRGQSILNDAILKIHIGMLDIDDRFQRLEPRLKLSNSQT